jgi:two-component system KDP operon response regulator KdpE
MPIFIIVLLDYKPFTYKPGFLVKPYLVVINANRKNLNALIARETAPKELFLDHAELLGKDTMRQAIIIGIDAQSRRSLKIGLLNRGYEVKAVTGYDEGLHLLQSFHPDIVLLEIGSSGPDEIDVLGAIKAWSTIPVIILASHSTKIEAVRVLEAGADDFLSIPFSIEILLARMNGLLRRTLPLPQEVPIKVGELTINPSSRSVIVGNREIALTRTEYAILVILANNPNKVVPNEKLLAALWGACAAKSKGNLRVHIFSLRKKIETDPSHPKFIITDPGFGHILSSSSTRESDHALLQ